MLVHRLPLGLAAGVNTLVANALGAGNARNAAKVFTTGVKSGAALQFGIAVSSLVAGPGLIRVLCTGVCVRVCVCAFCVRACIQALKWFALASY
jgi:Na+-driven multidrug efflux pump